MIKGFYLLLLPVLIIGQVVVSIPDTSMEQGLQYDIPVFLSEVDSNDQIVSIELSIAWDTTYLAIDSIGFSSIITSAWGDPTYSLFEGQLIIWFYGEEPIINSGILAFLNVRINDEAPIDSTLLNISHAYVNEGTPQVNTDYSNVVILPWDIIPPSQITDLFIDSVGSDYVQLIWTSQGDDDTSGTASSYDIRYAQIELNESNWNSANQVSITQQPLSYGQQEFFFIDSLNSTQQYYIGIKSIDDRDNVSMLSNIVDTTTVDIILPMVSLVYPNTGVTILAGHLETIQWLASDLSGIHMSYIYFSIDSGNSFTFIDSVLGYESEGYNFPNWEVPNIVNNSCMLKVTVVDNNNLIDSVQTDGTFSIVDIDAPIVEVINPPLITSFYEYDTLNIQWFAQDNIGIDSLVIIFNRGEDNFWLTISDDSENTSNYDWIIPSGIITEMGKIYISAFDESGNNTISESEGYFMVIDNTPPNVLINSPSEGTSLGIGDVIEIIWIAEDNVDISYVSLFYNTDANWISIVENILDENEYVWSIPNTPTNNLQLRLIGFDAVGLSDTSEVDSITIEISYPMVTNVSPASGSIDFRTNEFYFNFSQPLDTSTVTTDNVLITSMYSPSIGPTLTYIDTSTAIRVSFDDNIVSMDSISVTLTDQLTNVFGYGLDGDGDGEGGDSYMATYHTSMLADYDGDMAISVEDLSQFIINWDNDDYGNELGPFVGDMPHVYVAPDENYNYHDMGAFALMWNWYYANNTLAFTSYEDEGLPITIEAEHDSIYLDIPQDLSAYQVQIQYTPGSFFIGSSDNKDELFLTHEEKELGVYTIMAQPGQNKLAIPIEIRGRDASITISYKGITSQGEVAGKMTKSMTIENIPDEFVLYSNYPNPFNPTTKIDYGLPEVSNVKLVIYNILGREVTTLVNGVQDAGYKSITWHGTDAFGKNVGAGMYFYLIQAGEFRKVRKMVLLK